MSFGKDSVPTSKKGFVLAIEVHGVQMSENKSLKNTVKVAKE